jgi:hypothetical protein
LELSKIYYDKGDRLKKGKSWLGLAEDVIRKVCGLPDITPGHEWVKIPPSLYSPFVCIIMFSKANEEQDSLAVDAKAKAIISDNANEEDVVTYTDGSVIRNQRSAWAFIACLGCRIIQEASGAFAMTKK